VEFIREYFEPTENRDEWVSEKDVLVLYGVFKDKTHSIGDSLQQGPILHTNMERNSPTRSLLVGRRLKPQYANIINVHDRLTNLENDDMPQNTYAPMVFTLPNKTMVVEETFFALKQGANRDNGATTQYWVNIFTATQLRRVEKGVVNASTLYKQFMEWLGKFEDAFVVEGAEETRATFAQFMGWFTATRFGTILSTLNLPRSRRSRGVVYTGVELRSAPEDAEEVFEVS
jgi:hypothetical protein